MSKSKPQEPVELPVTEPEATTDRGSRALAFARRHPALTVIGALGVGLIGGLEVATGVLLGAGVTALLRGKPREATTAREHREEREHHEEREHRGWLDRVSPEMRKRGRAVVQAARGKLEPNGHSITP